MNYFNVNIKNMQLFIALFYSELYNIINIQYCFELVALSIILFQIT